MSDPTGNQPPSQQPADDRTTIRPPMGGPFGSSGSGGSTSASSKPPAAPEFGKDPTSRQQQPQQYGGRPQAAGRFRQAGAQPQQTMPLRTEQGPVGYQSGPAHQGQQGQPYIAPPGPGAPGPTGGPRRAGGKRSGLGAGLLAGALVIGGLAGLGGAAVYDKVSGPELTEQSAEGLDPLELVSVNSVTKKVAPSVVKITVVLDNDSGGYGSGSVLTSDGEILTNAHVVEGIEAQGGTITLTFSDGRTAEADLIGTDPYTDLALLKAKDMSGLPTMQLGDSDKTEVGQAVVALGSPYGLEGTVTAGIVSTLHRPLSIPLGSGEGSSYYDAIQTDAPINPGNSGGALVNMAGQLIGVNSAGRLATDLEGNASDTGSTGIGFAIPIDQAMATVEELRNGETPTHARLGVEGDTAEISPLVPGGAEVSGLLDGGPAEAGGIQEGDVITSVGGVHVATWEGLGTVLLGFRPEDQVDIVVVRDGQEETDSVTLGSDADE